VVVVISPALHDHLDELTEDQTFNEAIDNLVIAHRKGIHLVLASPKLLRRLVQVLPRLSGPLRQIAAHHHQSTAILDLVRQHIVVEAPPVAIVSKQHGGDKVVHHVPYSYFSNPLSALHPSRLIAEDSTDRDIYLTALRAYYCRHRSALRGLACAIAGFGGGGSSTEDQFRDHAQHGPTVALVDSDRQYPKAPLGATARAVTSAATQLPTCVCSVRVLPCHELENLLPASLVEECLSDDDGEAFRRRVLGITEGGLLDGSPDVAYLDLKRGLCHWDIEFCSTTDQRNYLQLQSDVRIKECTSTATCATRADCRCIHFAGFGESILVRVATKLRSLSAQKQADYFFAASTGSRDIWTEIARDLFSWACAPTPSRA
jgi:hypothetical protein